MQRDLVLLALISVFINTRYVEGEVCPSIDIRNNYTSLEKLRNCSIIMGNLRMVLIDTVFDGSVYDQYSFPKLTEIVDYMLVFKVAQLVTLGKLFPNLRVIRGRKLFQGYALVIYRVPHLQEIGLTGLQYIGRGAVKVDGCSNLCYVKTIEWREFGAWVLDFPSTEASDCKDELCPEKCSGHCWNKDECQKRNPNYCTQLNDVGKCVETCPKNKVIDHDAQRCISMEECSSMLNGTWWIFNGTCISSCPIFYVRDKTVDGGCRYVGDDYSKECVGGVVDTLDFLEDLKGCTHINGYLEIRISNSYLEQRLEDCLGNIKSISQYLKIGRSKAITSLEFLKNLTVIGGEELDKNLYSLFVYENENLRKLWKFTDDFQLTIPNGTIAFHDNPQLCLSEIKKLENAKGVNSKIDMQITSYSNGYKSVCNVKNMTINITENNPNNVTMVWERMNKTIDGLVIGYGLYFVANKNGSISSSDNKVGCDANSWDGVFVLDSTAQLKDLHPFTRYDFYIKTYRTGRQGEQTPTYYFVTASTEPSEPNNLTIADVSDTNIVLKWEKPKHENGELTHYTITKISEEDYLPLIHQRNYCKNPQTPDEDDDVALQLISMNLTKGDSCSCPEKTSSEIDTDDLKCPTNSEAFDGCVINSLYRREDITDKREMEYNDTYSEVVLVSANKTSYEFQSLQHFSLYVFYLKACNTNSNNETECGRSITISQRTKKKENADIIKDLSVRTDEKNAHVKWSEPEKFNSVLVAYEIEYKRTDSEHSKTRQECITQEEYQDLDGVYKIRELSPGKYQVRVKAVSLAGSGNFSKWRDFDIASEDGSVFVIVGPVIGCVVAAMVILGGWLWYRKKHAFDSNHLFTSINPDYAGSIYVEDEWEIDRSDVELIRELGQGSFGMVYQGIIKSRQYPCAVKTVNDGASMPSRMEFLNEGSVMKTFNDAHHVIKLLGIVSRGQPPLVVMELMERGDLKSYLRRCREPSQNLTTNELYRMAAEIADGMAYLSAKKFVHRDLAARNCMVAADRTVKIGDFGMARDVYETDYYRKETVGLLPVRWMAPESLADGVFTSDSDVWSYGIVLWEMATLAEQPYQGLSNEEVFHFVKNKGKLDRPAECSDFLHEVMDRCWAWRPIDRPTFSDIVNRLVDHVGEDFRLVAFSFSRQGRELALNAGPRVYNPPAMVPAPEDDYFSHYDPSEEEVNLYVKESNRPTTYLPFSNQRPSPYQISPGSPSSTFSMNST